MLVQHEHQHTGSPPQQPAPRRAIDIPSHRPHPSRPATATPQQGRDTSTSRRQPTRPYPVEGSIFSNEGVNHVWVTSRCSDLTIECDARVVLKPRPRRGHSPDVTPGPLTVTVVGEQVQVPHPGGTDPGLSYFRGRRLPADLAALERAGVPGHLRPRVRARPESFYLLEGSIATGELVSLYQQTSVPGEVDPNAPTMLGAMGYEGDLPARGSEMIGCLSVVFAVDGVAAAAAIGALALIVGLPRVLP